MENEELWEDMMQNIGGTSRKEKRKRGDDHSDYIR